MKELLRVEKDVRLWRIASPSGDFEEDGYLVDDATRTPETWSFWNRLEADAMFRRRVELAD